MLRSHITVKTFRQCMSEKLHHFICAITLSNQGLFLIIFGSRYIRKFSITRMFFIKSKVENQLKFQHNPEAASSRDTRLHHSTKSVDS